MNDKIIENGYGWKNNYFLLEKGTILEVVLDSYPWDAICDFSPYYNAAEDWYDVSAMVDYDIYEKILERLVENFKTKNKNNYLISIDNSQGRSFYNLHRKYPRACLFSGRVLTDCRDLEYDVIKAYFQYTILDLSLMMNHFEGYERIDKYLTYCKENNIDVSDIIAYKEFSVPKRKSPIIVFTTFDMAKKAKQPINDVLNEGVITFTKILDGDVFTAYEYNLEGRELRNHGPFFDNDISTNGIEKKFGISKERLGMYEDIFDCLDENIEKLGLN